MTRTEALCKELGLWPVWTERKNSVTEQMRSEKKFRVWDCDDLLFVIDCVEDDREIDQFLQNLLQSFLGQDRHNLSISEWREVGSVEALTVCHAKIKRCFYMGEKGQFRSPEGLSFYQGPTLPDVLKTPSIKAQLWAGWLFLTASKA